MTSSTHAALLWAALALFSPRAHALDCQAPTTQADMTACAFEDFQAANADQAAAIRAYEPRLAAGDRQRWRAAQKAWIGWRTAQCAFESGPAAGGSAREMLRWQCAARLTRERSAAIAWLAHCPEGDLACPGRKP